jgi:CO dehydrogenase maturation factor
MMKISVCGKGGSGKSSVTVLLAHGIRARGYDVVIIDSDESNSGLYRLLGFNEPPLPLLELVGGKQHVKNAFPKTPLATSEKEINVIARDRIPLADIPAPHVAQRDGISLIGVGKILQSLEGCACPMGVLGREFLRKLELNENQVALVDMEAGVEHFGRGVDTGIDTVLIVVDPSYESLLLAERISSMTSAIGISSIWTVLNKVTSPDVASKLTDHLMKSDLRVIGTISNDPEIFEAGLEGRPIQPRETPPAIAGILDTLLDGSGEGHPRGQ